MIQFTKAGRAVIALLAFGSPAFAEQGTYGEVLLTGMARNSWFANSFPEQNTMVCNVNGPDGFLTVRSGPDASFAKLRAFDRLAVLVVDLRQRQGNWIYVTEAYRNVTKNGDAQVFQALPVKGWVHDGYLCDFIH